MSSRTPVNGVGYDKSLLADAPQVTKADKQEGYNPDLLEAQHTPRATPAPTAGVLDPSKSKYAGASDESSGARHGAILQPSPKKPRSRKLLFIIIGAVILVIIAVGVGVGVGVSKARQGTTSTNLIPVSSSPTTTPKPVDVSSTGSDTGKPPGGAGETSTDPSAGGVATNAPGVVIPTTTKK